MMDLSSFDIFNNNKSTLKETSRDDSDRQNIKYMTENEAEAIDFDEVKRDYIRSLDIKKEELTSVDALIEVKNKEIFIEFKNGKIIYNKGKQKTTTWFNIQDKVRDSLLIFDDIVEKGSSYTRENMEFILVYNLEKNPMTPGEKEEVFKSEPFNSPSMSFISNKLFAKAKKEFIRFGVGKYKGIYFKNVHTYSRKEFAEYLSENI